MSSSPRIGAACVLSVCALGCGDSGAVDSGTAADSGASVSCFEVTGAGPEPWWDVRVIGREFGAYDNMRVRAVTAGGGRVGVADDVIVGGAFELAIPLTLNHSYYSEVDLYVDADGDDACDAAESLWGFVTGIVEDHLLLEVTPNELCVRDGGPRVGAGCRPWSAPFAPCFINGQTDLESSLPCP